MRTSVDIPDAIYPTLLAASERSGMSLGEYLASIAYERLGAASHHGVGNKPTASNGRTDPSLPDWWDRVPKAPPEEAREVQSIVDEEFSGVDAKDWE